MGMLTRHEPGELLTDAGWTGALPAARQRCAARQPHLSWWLAAALLLVTFVPLLPLALVAMSVDDLVAKLAGILV